MDSGPNEESQEVLEVALSDACSHPRAVMVLALNADATLIAMEGARRPHNHAGRAKGQCVGFLVGVDDHGRFETIIRKEIGQPVSIEGALSFRFVLNVNARCL